LGQIANQFEAGQAPLSGELLRGSYGQAARKIRAVLVKAGEAAAD
jgi:hypothetical protein